MILTDLSKRGSDKHFLLVTSDSCEQCLNFKQALTFIYESNSLPCPVFVAEFSENDISEAVELYQVNMIPTYIFYNGKVELKRWGGFFDGSLDNSSQKLLTLMNKALSELQ